MGMDLVGAGFTRRNDKECSIDTIDAIIDAIPNEKIGDDEFLNLIDPGGGLVLGEMDDPDDFLEVVRDALKSGAREFDSAVAGHRMSLSYSINGTPLEFVWTGGGSWGDDPFDGFTALCYFIELCGIDDGIAQSAGFVCGGLPNATTVAQYAKGK